MGSTRLPNKVMKKIEGIPMIGLLLQRLSKSIFIDEIVIATSVLDINRPLIDYAQELGVKTYQGSENDVLDRFFEASKMTNADVIVRITGDCPLIDAALVDECIKKLIDNKVDYVSNTLPPSYPDGLDVEVFTFSALSKAAKEANKSFEREHVTPYLRESDDFKKLGVQNKIDLSEMRWTVDEASDFELISSIFRYFKNNIYFDWVEVLGLQKADPDLFLVNQHLIRNEGAVMGTGQKLWRRAKSVIPGGNMLLSKRAEMFLPDQWPSYYSKAKGCSVWDLDGNEFIDMSIMGIGTNTLGYGNSAVDSAV
jgi:glutamate-1-semialdehyde 2,1-aminomutase